MSHASRWMETGVLGWLILDLTDSPWYVALVGVARSAPLLAFGLFAGLIADRTNRWLVMLCTQAINALMTGVLLVLLLFEAIQPWHVLLVAFILGCGTILDMPSRRSLIYDLVGPQQVVSAMSLETINNTVGKFLGPLIGGLMHRDDRLCGGVSPADGRLSAGRSASSFKSESTCPVQRRALNRSGKAW